MPERAQIAGPFSRKPEKPIGQRLSPVQETLAALMPTGLVLCGLLIFRALAGQPMLLASLASSAASVYFNPGHKMNETRSLVIAQVSAVLLGFLAFRVFGPGFHSAAAAMTATIVMMIALDAAHPPATSTSLSFSLRGEPVHDVVLFALVIGITATLVLLQRLIAWMIRRRETAVERLRG